METYSPQSVSWTVQEVNTGTIPPKDAHISVHKAHLLIIPHGIALISVLWATTGRQSTTPAKGHALPTTTLSTGPDSAAQTAWRSGTGTLTTLLQIVYVLAHLSPISSQIFLPASVTISVLVASMLTITLENAWRLPIVQMARLLSLIPKDASMSVLLKFLLFSTI